MNYQTIVFNQKKYEKGLSNTYKKDLGVFFTNDVCIVDKIIANIPLNDKTILDKKFLEPSCGNGVFIIRLLEQVFKIHCTTAEQAKAFIENSIFFIDIDEKMVEQTRLNISALFKNMFGMSHKGSFNGFVYDFTRKVLTRTNDLFSDESPVSPLGNLLGEIDYVIGNPPYVSLYGRRDRKKDEAQRVYYLANYNQFPDVLKNGKINYVMLFIEHSIDFLKEGGTLSFIIDIAFFETAYEYTRRFLLLNTRIISMETNITSFDVASGQLILTVKKEKVTHNTVRIVDSKTGQLILIDQSQWLTPNDQYKFRYNGSVANLNIVHKIASFRFPTLKELYPLKNLRTCVMLLDMESLFVFDEENHRFSDHIYPYYQGSKSLPFKFAPLQFTKYFHYNKELQDETNDKLKEELALQGIKNKKRLGLGEVAIYDNPKVYIRQSAKEIIASYDERPSSANNSLYVFSLRGNDLEKKNFLKFISGYLNSEIVTFYCQQMNIIRYSIGKQPQIKTSDLYTLPVPTNENLRRDIATIVDRIYLNDDIEAGVKDINDLVYSAFGLTQDEIEKVRKAIEAF